MRKGHFFKTHQASASNPSTEWSDLQDIGEAPAFAGHFETSVTRPTVRCRTDGELEVVQAVIGSRGGAVHGYRLRFAESLACEIGRGNR
jgi:hypothetical protein